MIEAFQALTGALEGLVHPEHQAKKELQVLEVLEERVTLVCLDDPVSLACLETKEIADNLVCNIVMLRFCNFDNYRASAYCC